MSQPPSDPVNVPDSATIYTPATLDPELRSAVNRALIKYGHSEKIQEHLLHALNADTSNWTTALQNRAQSHLRSGEVTTFPTLMKRILEDVRHETQAAATRSSDENNKKNGRAGGLNGASTNGKAKAVNGTSASEGSLAMPAAVVEEALKVTHESLKDVCYIDPADNSS